MHEAHQFVRRLQLLGSLIELVFTHRNQSSDFALHQPHVADGLHHVARTRLALGADHRCPLGDTAQGFTQILCATNERHVEFRLVDVVDIVSRTEHLALVDIVDLDGLQYLCLGNVSDATFRHHGNGDGILNATNHFRVAHAAHATRSTNVGRNPFQSHYGTSACFLSDASLFWGCHVHNHAAFQHLSQLAVKFLS